MELTIAQKLDLQNLKKTQTFSSANFTFTPHKKFLNHSFRELSTEAWPAFTHNTDRIKQKSHIRPDAELDSNRPLQCSTSGSSARPVPCSCVFYQGFLQTRSGILSNWSSRPDSTHGSVQTFRFHGVFWEDLVQGIRRTKESSHGKNVLRRNFYSWENVSHEQKRFFFVLSQRFVYELELLNKQEMKFQNPSLSTPEIRSSTISELLQLCIWKNLLHDINTLSI